MIRVKRVYEEASRDDGKRVLVDRVWPRGVSRDKLCLDEWMKDIAPSTGLRKWFGHRRERWGEFARRYEEELRAPGHAGQLRRLADWARAGTLTLLYSARDEECNQAVVLVAVLVRDYESKRQGRK